MSLYYSLDSAPPCEGYGEIDEFSIPSWLVNACRKSEFQHIPSQPLRIGVFPGVRGLLDFYLPHGSVPVISMKLRQVFDSAGILPGELLYRQLRLFSPDGAEEQYYLALPQKINCLDRTVINPLGGTDELFISDAAVGCFNIFKVAGITNKTILITEKLKLALESSDITGVIFPETINNGGQS